MLFRSTSTWYYLTATDTQMGAPCGVTIDSVWVEVVASSEFLPILGMSLGADTIVCGADSVSLSAGNGVGWQYAWNTGDSTATVWVLGVGAYSVTVTNALAMGGDTSLHCLMASDTLELINFPAPQALPPDFAGRDTVICLGDTVRLGIPAAPGGWDFLWMPAAYLSDTSAAQPAASPSVSVGVSVTARDSASGGTCLQVRDTVNIVVEQPFVHAAPEDVTFCIGECFNLGVPAVGGMVYAWSPVAGLTDPSASLTRAQPSATTVYTLSIVNPALQSANCREKNYIVVATADACNHQSFILVNGDGIAETLDLGDHVGRVELWVWDMAGRLVRHFGDYQNDPMAIGWDASDMARGMYVYRVAVSGDPIPIAIGTIGCPSTFTGKVVVIR